MDGHTLLVFACAGAWNVPLMGWAVHKRGWLLYPWHAQFWDGSETSDAACDRGPCFEVLRVYVGNQVRSIHCFNTFLHFAERHLHIIPR